MRFLGYRVENYKLFVFVVSAVIAGIAGALYVPQVGIINPSEFDPANSIEAVIWVAVGGRGTLIGAALGAIVVNFAKTYFTGAFPEYWLFALGGLFVLVTLFLPKGLMGLIAARKAPAAPAPTPVPAPGRRARRACNERKRQSQADEFAALSRRRQRLLRRLQGAARPVAGAGAGRDARDHRPQRRGQDDDDGRHHRQDAARRGRRLFRGPARPDPARRGRDRRTRRRPQVPEADGVREPHRLRQHPARRQGAALGVRDAVRRRRRNKSARRSNASWPRSASPISASASPARCRTARSNGWRSACCSPRTPSSCWSTNPSPA